MEEFLPMNTPSEDQLRTVRQKLIERGAELRERIDRARGERFIRPGDQLQELRVRLRQQRLGQRLARRKLV